VHEVDEHVPNRGTGERVLGADVAGDLVRSVRPYRAGDPSHLVHWSSTARAGELMVRELEPPVEPGLALVLEMEPGVGNPRSERAASTAAGVALTVLERGGPVVLCTAEEAGPVSRPVQSRVDLSRRLAAATSGPPGAPPEGWPAVVIR
jgi:uncharacterized protein (DUF58 family)